MMLFYLSVASGTQRKVAEHLKYPHILINYMTKSNTPPKCARTLFVDSGGFPSSYIHNGYSKTDEEYLRFVMKHRADYYALRDYPCEPQILRRHGVTVRQQIERTLTHHLKLLDMHEKMSVHAVPVPVIQGWRMSDYTECIDLFREHGLLAEYMAVGSLCRRHQVKKIRRIILSVRKELPSWVRLHAFGTKISVLKNQDVANAIYSVDSSAAEFSARLRRFRLAQHSGDIPSTFDISLEETRRYLQKVRRLVRRRHDNTVQTCMSHFLRSRRRCSEAACS
jgi:hypothetical protein